MALVDAFDEHVSWVVVHILFQDSDVLHISYLGTVHDSSSEASFLH